MIRVSIIAAQNGTPTERVSVLRFQEGFNREEGTGFTHCTRIHFLHCPAAHAADWVYLGKAHVDGQHDHDNIEVGSAAGRYRKLEIRVVNAPIEFDRVVVHYGNGQAETLQVRQFIRAGGHTRGIALQGDRIVQSLELWYGKAQPFSARPEVTLFGRP